MKSRRIVLIGLLCVGFIFVQAFPCVAARGVTENSIKLGLIMVKTGPVAALGYPEGQGMVDYFNYLNEQGGINGRKVKIIWEDDQFQAPKSVAAVKKLIHSDRVLTIITLGGGNQTMANIQATERYKICNVPNTCEKRLYDPFRPYVYVAGAGYDVQHQCMIDYIINDLKSKDAKVGIVHATRGYQKDAVKATKERLKKYGIEPAIDLVLRTGVVDASSQVLALKNAKVEYVISTNMAVPLIPFLKAAKKIDYSPVVFGNNWATDDVLIAACGDLARNFIGVNFVNSWSFDTRGVKLAREMAKKYGRKLKMKSVYLHGFGASMILAEGIKRTGQDLTPETLKKALDTLRDFDTGIFYPVSYTSKDHTPPPFVRFFRPDLEKKGFVPMTEWRSPKKLK